MASSGSKREVSPLEKHEVKRSSSLWCYLQAIQSCEVFRIYFRASSTSCRSTRLTPRQWRHVRERWRCDKWFLNFFCLWLCETLTEYTRYVRLNKAMIWFDLNHRVKMYIEFRLLHLSMQSFDNNFEGSNHRYFNRKQCWLMQHLILRKLGKVNFELREHCIYSVVCTLAPLKYTKFKS